MERLRNPLARQHLDIAPHQEAHAMFIPSLTRPFRVPKFSQKESQNTAVKSRASEPGDNYVADSDARAARVAAQRLERLIGRPRNATLPFLLEAARALPTPSDRRAWLEAALYDHDLRASHVDAPTARMMIARLTLAGIESQMEKPDARTLLGRIQAMQAAHDLAEHAFEAIVEPETRSLANFANEAQKMLNTPAASLALIQDALTHLTTLPEESPVEVSAAIATMAMTHMNQAGRTPSEQEALGMAALRTITDLRGTPLLQTRLMEAEREADLKKRIARIRTALQAEA